MAGFGARDVAAVLRGAAAILRDRGWTRGAWARTGCGGPCEPVDRRAKQFCAVGACVRAAAERSLGEFCADAAAAALGAQAGIETGPYDLRRRVGGWNDAETSADAVIGVIDAAAAGVEAAFNRPGNVG